MQVELRFELSPNTSGDYIASTLVEQYSGVQSIDLRAGLWDSQASVSQATYGLEAVNLHATEVDKVRVRAKRPTS